MSVDAQKVQLANKDGEFITNTIRAFVEASLQLNSQFVVNGNPMPVGLELSSAPVNITNPVPVSIQIGSVQIASTNPVPVTLQLGNTAVTTANPIPVVQNGATNIFFSQGTASSTGYTPQQAFGITSRHVKLINDGTAIINFSFGGIVDSGIAKQNEILQFDDLGLTQIYVKAITTGGTYRVWAW